MYVAMNNILKEPGSLKLSSKLTISYPKSARIPASTLSAPDIQEEHILLEPLGYQSVDPLLPRAALHL